MNMVKAVVSLLNLLGYQVLKTICLLSNINCLRHVVHVGLKAGTAFKAWSSARKWQEYVSHYLRQRALKTIPWFSVIIVYKGSKTVSATSSLVVTSTDYQEEAK